MTYLERIAELESQLATLKADVLAESTPSEWVPAGGDYYLYSDGTVTMRTTTLSEKTAGICYATEQQAIQAALNMRSFNRMQAWLAENDDGWVADWNNTDQSKYFVMFDVRTNRYIYTFDVVWRDLSNLYMSEENVKKLCALLNSSTVKF